MRRSSISAVGSLNLPHVPDIPGMETFAGPSFHSARWPDDLDITGTRFALIGAGASGFQIAPTIADEVAQLTIYQRTAQWMFPNPVYRTQGAGRRSLGAAPPAVLRALVPVHDDLSRHRVRHRRRTAAIRTTTTPTAWRSTRPTPPAA